MRSEAPARGEPDLGTLGGILERAAGYPEAGLRFLDRREQESWASWPEVRAAAAQVAGGLAAAGVGRGERVGLIYPTCVEFFHAFFGTVLAGAVPVPLYPPARLGRLDEYHRRTAAMLRAAGARLVLAEPRLKRFLGETLAAARPPLGGLTLAELPRAGELAAVAASSDLALVQFSSGTTVEPKPVALSHRAVLSQVDAINSFWPPDAGTLPTGVSWLPLYHDMGLIGCIFPAVALPSVMTLIGPEVFVARPASWLRAISRYRATISVAPNFAFGLCVEKIADHELDGVDLAPWRIALNGAESIAPGVLRAFQERFARWGFRREALTPVYGLSEATLAVTFSALEEPFRTGRFDRERLARAGVLEQDPEGLELVSVGRPLPGFELRIVDPAGELAGPLREGRVWVRGPSLMDGYLDRPESTAEALRGGWLDTGDLGFLDESGELFLTGRAKDVLILRGRNYAPVDVEQAVDGLEGLRRGCVVAVSWLPEGGSGERLAVLAERARDAAPHHLGGLGNRIRDAVLARTGLRLDEVHLLEPGTLPRTSSGKLRRRAALERHRRGELLPPRAVTPWLVAGAYARSALGHLRLRRRERGDG